tara:strand:- start:12545 stop:13216 length:672 start_codon:yes stop_codon:yes gene_type:complete
MTLIAWPRTAAFDRVVPKRKIYEHGAVGSALKERFVQQVEQISWAYKLAPETVNLPATKTVTEIQVFRIALKGAELDRGVLQAIDRAIPFPLIFELIQGTRIKVAAAYKQSTLSQKGEGDSNRWRMSNYFETDWQPEHTIRRPLPVALGMSGLYEQLLHHLIPIPIRPEESLADAVERVEQLEAKQREINKIKALLKREKQFNRKVEINAELRRMKADLESLK